MKNKFKVYITNENKETEVIYINTSPLELKLLEPKNIISAHVDFSDNKKIKTLNKTSFIYKVKNNEVLFIEEFYDIVKKDEENYIVETREEVIGYYNDETKEKFAEEKLFDTLFNLNTRLIDYNDLFVLMISLLYNDNRDAMYELFDIIRVNFEFFLELIIPMVLTYEKNWFNDEPIDLDNIELSDFSIALDELEILKDIKVNNTNESYIYYRDEHFYNSEVLFKNLKPNSFILSNLAQLFFSEEYDFLIKIGQSYPKVIIYNFLYKQIKLNNNKYLLNLMDEEVIGIINDSKHYELMSIISYLKINENNKNFNLNVFTRFITHIFKLRMKDKHRGVYHNKSLDILSAEYRAADILYFKEQVNKVLIDFNNVDIEKLLGITFKDMMLHSSISKSMGNRDEFEISISLPAKEIYTMYLLKKGSEYLNLDFNYNEYISLDSQLEELEEKLKEINGEEANFQELFMTEEEKEELLIPF